MPRDAFVLEIQRKLCHPKCVRKLSKLSRNGPQITVDVMYATPLCTTVSLETDLGANCQCDELPKLMEELAGPLRQMQVCIACSLFSKSNI